MVDDVKTLEDVVVTGYSNVRKSSFTGSSTQISGDDPDGDIYYVGAKINILSWKIVSQDVEL